MRYVMVPVPSEYVLDLLRWLQFRTEPEQPEEDEANLRRLLGETDDRTRALLLLIAKGAIEGAPVRLSDAADLLEQDGPTVRAALLAADAQALGPDRTLVKVLNETEVNEFGRSGRVSYLAMRPHHARIVRATVRGLATARD
jgi:hypothetical protein